MRKLILLVSIILAGAWVLSVGSGPPATQKEPTFDHVIAKVPVEVDVFYAGAITPVNVVYVHSDNSYVKNGRTVLIAKNASEESLSATAKDVTPIKLCHEDPGRYSNEGYIAKENTVNDPVKYGRYRSQENS